MLEGKGEISIRNSVLEDATIINNNQEKKKLPISYSELKGYNTIENIKTIDCSVLNRANILGTKQNPMVVTDQFIDGSIDNQEITMKEQDSTKLNLSKSWLNLLEI